MNGRPLRVWLVDDDASIRWVLERALRDGGMLPKTFEALPMCWSPTSGCPGSPGWSW
jgi:DNA-binding NtrC family response regulator